MSLLSNSMAVIRYKVSGVLSAPVNEKILAALKQNSIEALSNEDTTKKIGWTTIEKPYRPYFDDFSFVYANYIAFALRVDKKTIPAKLVKQQFTMECERKLDESGREYLSAKEKKEIREHVTSLLGMRMPAVPEVYELVWQHETQNLYFFSNLKSANEDLEHLFSHSFNLKLMHMFPYTYATLAANLSSAETDALDNIKPLDMAGF